jgi:hypothetical protein
MSPTFTTVTLFLYACMSLVFIALLYGSLSRALSSSVFNGTASLLSFNLSSKVLTKLRPLPFP